MSEFRYANRAKNVVARTHTAMRPNQINLGGGFAFPGSLPDLSEVAAEAAREHRVECLQYGPLFGLSELRDAIASFLKEDGVLADRENILVTSGAKNALDLVLKVFIEKGDSVIVSNPSYATGIQIIRNHEATFVDIDMDNEGLRVDQLERELNRLREHGSVIPKLLYDVPDFHNPTGITLSAVRRQKLVDLAEQFDFVIVEDDPYRWLRFTGKTVPPIKSLDETGRVIGLGTFSKIFAPGIRLGWAVGDPAIIGCLAAFKSESGASPLIQQIALEQLRSGGIKRHIGEFIPILESHKNAMKRALQEYLPEVKFREPHGGYYYWIELPERIDADEVTAIAEQEGVTIFSGRGYFANKPPGNFFRLSFAMSTEEQIETGVCKLGEIVNRIDNSSSRTAFLPSKQQHFD